MQVIYVILIAINIIDFLQAAFIHYIYLAFTLTHSTEEEGQHDALAH